MAGAGDAQRVVPADRWDIDSIYSPDTLPGKMSVSVRHGTALSCLPLTMPQLASFCKTSSTASLEPAASRWPPCA